MKPNEVECCGLIRSTPFCPLCGKDLRPGAPLVSLLRHVAGVAGRTRDTADETTGDIKMRRKRLKSAEKWKAWRDELSKLLNLTEDE